MNTAFSSQPNSNVTPSQYEIAQGARELSADAEDRLHSADEMTDVTAVTRATLAYPVTRAEINTDSTSVKTRRAR